MKTHSFIIVFFDVGLFLVRFINGLWVQREKGGVYGSDKQRRYYYQRDTREHASLLGPFMKAWISS